MTKHQSILAIEIPARDLLLICGKCGRKLDGGFGKKGRQDLRAMLKRALREGGHRRDIRVMETACLSLCPKNAVTLARASRPHQLLAVPAGTDIDTLLTALDLGPGTSMLEADMKHG